MQRFEVGKTMPGLAPKTNGPSLHLEPSGLMLLLQFPRANKHEVAAFNKGVLNCGFVEMGANGVPVCFFAIEFGYPINAMDASFNARLVRPDILAAFLTGEPKNMLHILLFDGETILAQKIYGLDLGQLAKFHQIISKQLTIEYAQEEFFSSLREIYSAVSSLELLHVATGK